MELITFRKASLDLGILFKKKKQKPRYRKEDEEEEDKENALMNVVKL